MIIISEDLRRYIDAFDTREEACKWLDTPYTTLIAYLNRERSVGEDFIERIKHKVGWSFERSFSIEEEKKND